MGIWLQKLIPPNRTMDPVSRYTSHAWARFCIQVPMREMSCPRKTAENYGIAGLAASRAVLALLLFKAQPVLWSRLGGSAGRPPGQGRAVARLGKLKLTHVRKADDFVG